MKVHIDDIVVNGEVKGKLYIESDTLGYQVKTITGTRIDDKGKEIEMSTTHGYFGTLGGCVKHIFSMKIKESTATTLSELVQDIERIETYIRSKMAV